MNDVAARVVTDRNTDRQTDRHTKHVTLASPECQELTNVMVKRNILHKIGIRHDYLQLDTQQIMINTLCCRFRSALDFIKIFSISL